MKSFLKILTISCIFHIGIVKAESEMNLAKTFQNPLGVNPEARHYTLPFVNYTNFGYGTNHNTQNMLDVKPVMPLPLTNSMDLILRTIIPITHQPTNNGYANGLGDINPTAFFTPAMNSSVIWGIGPTLIMPTATNRNLGAGKWSVGPELVLIAMPKQWTLAILTNNVWSVAGQSDRPPVHQFTFQYFITYNFMHGWYVTTQPSSTANWLASRSQMWTVPVGGGGGRTFHLGTQAMNISLQGYYNVVHPSVGPRWTMQATIEFLFDDNRTRYDNQFNNQKLAS